MTLKPHQKKKGPVRGRKPKTAITPHLIKHAIDYGRFDWMQRDALGWVRCPTGKLAAHFKISNAELKSSLYSLENWELVREVRWNRYYIEILQQVPIGMSFLVEPQTITTQEGKLEYFDLTEED